MEYPQLRITQYKYPMTHDLWGKNTTEYRSAHAHCTPGHSFKGTNFFTAKNFINHVKLRGKFLAGIFLLALGGENIWNTNCDVES